jgi:ubiquinone/menaquinone biosynthesis C-methylase UbiE
MTEQIKLKFSEKYDKAHAQRYFQKHQDGLSRRLSHFRDEQLARRALDLAGQPQVVLDLPCGAGRFWPLLAEQPGRVIIGADNSAEMLQTARESQPPEVVSRVRSLHTSAFAIDLPDNAVDSVFCMRLLHHVGDAAHRLSLMKELHRVTRNSVIISLWVDGNFKAWKRLRHERRRAARGEQQGYQNRFVIPVETAEAEFVQAGFDIQQRLDFLPHYAMWRVYVLSKQ